MKNMSIVQSKMCIAVIPVLRLLIGFFLYILFDHLWFEFGLTLCSVTLYFYVTNTTNRWVLEKFSRYLEEYELGFYRSYVFASISIGLISFVFYFADWEDRLEFGIFKIIDVLAILFIFDYTTSYTFWKRFYSVFHPMHLGWYGTKELLLTSFPEKKIELLRTPLSPEEIKIYLSNIDFSNDDEIELFTTNCQMIYLRNHYNFEPYKLHRGIERKVIMRYIHHFYLRVKVYVLCEATKSHIFELVYYHLSEQKHLEQKEEGGGDYQEEIYEKFISMLPDTKFRALFPIIL